MKFIILRLVGQLVLTPQDSMEQRSYNQERGETHGPTVSLVEQTACFPIKEV